MAYHLTKKGYPAECGATQRRCPNAHYSTEKQAAVAGLRQLVDRKSIPDYPGRFGAHGKAEEVEQAVQILATHPRDTPINRILDEAEAKTYTSDAVKFYVKKLSPEWNNWKSLVNSSKNLLKAPKPNSGWEANYNHELAKMVAKEGSLVSEGDTYYGWHDFSRNGRQAKVAVVLNVKEDRWTEFAGTFADHDDEGTGFSADVILEDGSVRKMRYEASVDTVLREITKGIWK